MSKKKNILRRLAREAQQDIIPSNGDSTMYYTNRVARLQKDIYNANLAGYEATSNVLGDRLKTAQDKLNAYKTKRAGYKSLNELTDEEKKLGTKKIGGQVKNAKKVRVSAGGEKHVVYKKTNMIGKGKPGDIMVNHPTKDKGKWDTINLTKIGKAKTVAQGVSATKKWHKENPDYKYKKRK